MGIKNFFKLAEAAAHPSKWKDHANTRIAVDASIFLYSASLGLSRIDVLTSAEGEPTSYLNALYALAVRCRHFNISPIMIFDGIPPELKSKTLTERREYKQQRQEELATAERLTEDEVDESTLSATDVAKLLTMRARIGKQSIDELKKRAFTLPDSTISDSKTLLDKLGIPYITAPDGYEAEHLAAQLTIDGHADAVYTADADSLVFGAKRMIRRMPGGKLLDYHLADVLSVLSLTTRVELANIAVALGSDFAPKVKGIGMKSYIKARDGRDFTDEQQRARDFFLSPCPYDFTKLHVGNPDINAAIQWLVDVKGFNEERLRKMIKD